ncbi:MAG: PaaI family thioesterase [Eubacteriales bacterium]|nr:PaaI family thioesterase [Eubacteriales bacterium]
MEHGTMIDMENPKIAFAMRMVKNNPFMQWNHIRLTELDEDHCIGYVDLQPEQKNPNGLAHGGLLFTISDVIASTVARADGRNYSTLDADVHFLRNVKEGRIYGEASVIRRGRTSVLIETILRSEAGKELVRATVTMFCIGPGVVPAQKAGN